MGTEKPSFALLLGCLLAFVCAFYYVIVFVCLLLLFVVCLFVWLVAFVLFCVGFLPAYWHCLCVICVCYISMLFFFIHVCLFGCFVLSSLFCSYVRRFVVYWRPLGITFVFAVFACSFLLFDCFDLLLALLFF